MYRQPNTEHFAEHKKALSGTTKTISRKVNYATKAAIERLVPVLIETAKEAGLAIGGVEVGADGSIRIIQTQTLAPATPFERWRAEQGQ